jgi:hypothetical protein
MDTIDPGAGGNNIDLKADEDLKNQAVGIKTRGLIVSEVEHAVVSRSCDKIWWGDRGLCVATNGRRTKHLTAQRHNGRLTVAPWIRPLQLKVDRLNITVRCEPNAALGSHPVPADTLVRPNR